MSRSTALAFAPDRRPLEIVEFRNSHGWAPSIWGRLLRCLGYDDRWMHDDTGLNWLWQNIEELPEWQQAALVLTFDTGVIPFQAYAWAADMLDEFEKRLPAPDGHANHVPAMAELLRTSGFEAPFFGVWCTSVTDNPFDPWDEEADAPGTGIALTAMYVLERHRCYLPASSDVQDQPYATGGVIQPEDAPWADEHGIHPPPMPVQDQETTP